MSRSRIGARPWITFRSVPLYLISEGFHVCWHSKQGGLSWSCVGKWQFPFFWLHIGHCLLIAVRFIFQASWPVVFSCMFLSISKSSSMALRPSTWGFKTSYPASLFLLAASVFAHSSWLSHPVKYMAPATKDFGIKIRRPLQKSNSWITSSYWRLWQCTRIWTGHSQKPHGSIEVFFWCRVLYQSRPVVVEGRWEIGQKGEGNVRIFVLFPCPVVWGWYIRSLHVFSSTSCCIEFRENPRPGLTVLWPQPTIYIDKCTLYTYTVYMYTAL